MSDFFAGSISGLSQTLVGHPFDTIKVLIQNNRSHTGLQFKDYYRGIMYPMISNSIINGILFPTYNYSMERTHKNTILSGMFAGFIVSPIIYIFDYGKVMRQTKQKLNFSHIFQNKMKGIPLTFSREMMAFAAYFTSYDYFKNEMGWNPLVSGGLAGLTNWTTTYPLDVLRNRQIANRISMMEAYAMGHLWKGYTICAIRAVCVNSVGFYMYELCRDT